MRCLMISFCILLLWQSLAYAKDPEAAAQEAVARARMLYDKSFDAGHPWRESRRHLQVAETALAAGDLAKTITEADTAALLAEAALEQAAGEAGASKTRFPFAQ